MNIVETKQQEIEALCQKNNIGFLGLFGSVARGDDTPTSDVDLLVRFDKRITLFELIHIENEFKDVLQRKVDLITVGGLNHRIKPYVFKDLKPIYGQSVQG